MFKSVRDRVFAPPLCALLIAGATACGDSSDDADGGREAPAATSTIAAPITTIPTTTAAKFIEVTFSGGQVSGGARQETVKVGEQVRIRAVADVVEELHVHTYDQRVALQPGQPGEAVFTASIPGRHEVEFEKSGRRALTLQVG